MIKPLSSTLCKSCLGLTLLSFVTVLLLELNLVNCIAVPHIHHSKDKLMKENEIHGAYSPRDQNHYKDGEHRNDFDHEAILGSKNEAEEFDKLTPAESKRRLRSLALKMDKDEDGLVDRRELTNWVLKSFALLTEEEAQERLEDNDANEDGRVSWDEHLQETFGNYDDEEDDSYTRDMIEEKRMIKEDQELFKAADINNDGHLDKKEYSGFSHPEEFNHMHETLYQQTMTKKDINNDGYLSLEEFLLDDSGNNLHPNSEVYVIEKDRFEHDYDKNKDGKLSREEVVNWLIPNNREMAETEADHLIDSADNNGDGKLSIQEIVSHHEVFVGSEATDFGEHLHHTHKFEEEL